MTDTDESKNVYHKDRIYLFFDYLKESGTLKGNVEQPKIEFDFIEFRDLFAKANNVVEQHSFNLLVQQIKDTIKTELSESIKYLSGISFKIDDADFLRKSDLNFLQLNLNEKTFEM